MNLNPFWRSRHLSWHFIYSVYTISQNLTEYEPHPCLHKNLSIATWFFFSGLLHNGSLPTNIEQMVQAPKFDWDLTFEETRFWNFRLTTDALNVFPTSHLQFKIVELFLFSVNIFSKLRSWLKNPTALIFFRSALIFRAVGWFAFAAWFVTPLWRLRLYTSSHVVGIALGE